VSNFDNSIKKSSNESSELTSDLTCSKAESKSSSSGSGQLIAELKLQTEKGICHFKIFNSDYQETLLKEIMSIGGLPQSVEGALGAYIQ